MAWMAALPPGAQLPYPERMQHDVQISDGCVWWLLWQRGGSVVDANAPAAGIRSARRPNAGAPAPSLPLPRAATCMPATQS